jgi:hypothetical protein
MRAADAPAHLPRLFTGLGRQKLASTPCQTVLSSSNCSLALCGARRGYQSIRCCSNQPHPTTLRLLLERLSAAFTRHAAAISTLPGPDGLGSSSTAIRLSELFFELHARLFQRSAFLRLGRGCSRFSAGARPVTQGAATLAGSKIMLDCNEPRRTASW